MYNFWKYTTLTVACIILVVSMPLFVAYGISEGLSRFFKYLINLIAENRLSKFLIMKTGEAVVKDMEEDVE